MRTGDLVRHKIIYGLGVGLVVRSCDRATASVRVLWPKHQNIGPTLENIVSLEKISENR